MSSLELQQPEYLLLLGAGASAEPGLPIATEMTKRLIGVVEDQGDPALTKALSFVIGGIHFLQGIRGRFPDGNTNIEDVASTVDLLLGRRSHQLTPFVGAWNAVFHEVDASAGIADDSLRRVGSILKDQIRIWLETPPIGKIRHFDALRDFVKGIGSYVDVFTLNYDRCVEVALENGEVPFTTGFTTNGWDATQFQMPEFQVRIYKLHGSLDWFREDEAIYSAQFPPGGMEVASDYEPVLIFGQLNKLQPTDPFLYLSHTFSERVKAAKVVVTVGYGYGDGYINDIVQQGFSKDARKRLIVVGRNEASALQAVQRFSAGPSLLKAERVRILECGSTEAFSSGQLVSAIKENIGLASDEGPFE